tara:strand:- start:4848 stop:6077 length:1230 start_codon:yes stop_codon:yes gene_type:complete
MNKINNIYLIILLSFLIKIFAIFYVGDERIMNEWSYIIHNYNFSGILGYNVVISEFDALPMYAKENDTVLPTAFMPPLYFFYIYILQSLSFEIFDLSKLLIFSQIILSSISIFYLHKILIELGNSKYSNIFTALYAFFPINIYASTQVSSITLQLFLLIFFLYFLIKIFKKPAIKNLIIFSIFSSLLILARGEFIIFFILTLCYLFIFFKFDFKSFLISIFITLFLISPYLYRNYKVFDEIVLTKSLGYNLLKGNYKEFKEEGNPGIIETDFKISSLGIKTDKYFEINLDNFYKEKALDYIKTNPLEFTKNYFRKIIAFLFFDINSTYPGYYNFIHIIPKLILSILSLFGLIEMFNKKGFTQFVALYYTFNVLFFSIFFILPRYSLIILPIQIILSINGGKFLLRKINN